MLGPRPRSRTYSTAKTYGRLFSDILSMRLHKGDDILTLENRIKDLTGARHAIAMPQGRVAIFAAIRALIRPGQKVILSPYTIYEVVNMVICAGGIPVFADIRRDTCNIDPHEVDSLIDDQTGAVLVTHLHGLAADIEQLADLCRARGVALVEDAAQSFGGRVSGKYLGTFGDAGIFSFGLYKNINAFYGGMLVTSRTDIAKRISQEVRQWPRQPLWPLVRRAGYGLFTEILTWPPLFGTLVYRIFRFAYLHDIESLNRRVREENNPHVKYELPARYLRQLSQAQARLVLQRLPLVEDDFRTRLRFARMYHEGLNDLREIILPPFFEDGRHIYLQYPIQYRDRKALVKYMLRAGCDVYAQHMRNCADLACFSRYGRDCPNARATANSVVVLPTYPKYHEDDVRRNIKAIRDFVQQLSAEDRRSSINDATVVLARATGSGSVTRC